MDDEREFGTVLYRLNRVEDDLRKFERLMTTAAEGLRDVHHLEVESLRKDIYTRAEAQNIFPTREEIRRHQRTHGENLSIALVALSVVATIVNVILTHV